MSMLTKPDHTISLNDSINCYEICSNVFAENLICMALSNRLSLYLVSMPEESGEFLSNHVQDLKIEAIDTRCHVLAFSPDTSLNSNPNSVVICAAIGTNEMKVFRTDLNQSHTVQSLPGHTDYINDIAWVCDGEFIASVSDDFSCKFWGVDENMKNVTTFCLSSAGMSVKGHPEDPNKVLVAEKRGIIHLYNVRSKNTTLSVESPKFPLMSADWSNQNRLLITAIAAGDIIIWDLRRPFMPADIKQVHEDGGRIVRFAPGSAEAVIASIGRPDLTLKVFAAKSTVPLLESTLKTFGGLAWHHKLPYISAASDRKLNFWKVQMK